MGGTGTLQSAVLKDGVNAHATSFDLRSWQGLTLVLKTGKEFLTEPGAYAEFRNLVLQYAQQGGDIEIKKQIDAIIATFSKPQEKKAVEVVETPAVSAEKDVEAESTKKASSVQKESATTPKVIGRRLVPRFGTGDTEMNDSEPVGTPQSPKEIAVETVASEAHVVQEAPVPVFVPEPEPVRSAPKTLEEHRARIAEIKRAVHEHIGNPVALMGTKDGKGKVYMGALLDALKATTAGAGGSAEGTMFALEEAYRALIGAHTEARVEVKVMHEEVTAPVKEGTAPSIGKSTELPHIPPTSEQGVEHKAEVVSETKPDSVPAIDTAETTPPETPRQREVIRSSFKRSDNTIASVVSSVHRNKHTAGDTLLAILADETSPLPAVEEPVDVVRVAPVAVPPPLEEKEIPVVVPVPPVIEKHEEVAEPDAHDEEEKKVPTKVELPHEAWSSRGVALVPTDELVKKEGIDPKVVAVKQSELSSPEISAMLDKLLHEWSMFSGSGLFGIGPGGLAHPLFRKLAPLSMGEVMAGRWEGTDPKIVKVIKQYVDAWRHEQAITFTTNETFEHYLRRVVQRILKRQGR